MLIMAEKIKMIFGNPNPLKLHGDLITNPVHYKAVGKFQFAMRLYAGHNAIAFLTNAIDSFPQKVNREGYMAYDNPSPNLWAHAYISGSYGSNTESFRYCTGSRDTGVTTYVIDFENYTVHQYNTNGDLLKASEYPKMKDIYEKEMVMTVQNYFMEPSGTFWFWDGSPGYELPYVVDGVQTLYQHLNNTGYKIYKNDNDLYGLKII